MATILDQRKSLHPVGANDEHLLSVYVPVTPKMELADDTL